MGPAAKPTMDSDALKAFINKGATVSLPKHSYWFDFWVFLVFDVALVLFMHYIVP